LNGGLAKGFKNAHRISFEGNREKLKTVLSEMKVELPDKAVAFFAINGIKVINDSWVSDGDIIDIFPVVAGG
jgi:molybdopterin converting factor small subunit